ncbi:hypothetical protein E4U60_000472, partial [Claviceps pazoutovae]
TPSLRTSNILSGSTASAARGRPGRQAADPRPVRPAHARLGLGHNARRVVRRRRDGVGTHRPCLSGGSPAGCLPRPRHLCR